MKPLKTKVEGRKGRRHTRRLWMEMEYGRPRTGRFFCLLLMGIVLLPACFAGNSLLNHWVYRDAGGDSNDGSTHIPADFFIVCPQTARVSIDIPKSLALFFSHRPAAWLAIRGRWLPARSWRPRAPGGR